MLRFIILILMFTFSVSSFSHTIDLRQIDYPLENIDGEVEFHAITVEVVNGEVLWQGDMLVGYLDPNGEIVLYGHQEMGANHDAGIQSVIMNGFRWPGGVVPYTINSDLSSSTTLIRQSMNSIENASGVRFVQRTNQSNYVTFRSSPIERNCTANPGMRGGQQFITLGSGCLVPYVITHEILHALGFKHTHSRSDREQHVIIYWNRIQPDFHSAYEMVNVNTHQNVGPYDFSSVMHYMGHEFAITEGTRTMVRRSNPTASLGGTSLSVGDRNTLVEMYGRYQNVQLSAQSFRCYGQAVLNWTSSPKVVSYRVQASSIFSGFWYNASPLITNQLYSVDASQSMFYRIMGCDSDGQCEVISDTVEVQYYPVCM